jgi:hypothetical protein
MPRWTWQNGLWLAAYLGWMTLVVVFLLQFRQQQIAEFGTAKSQQDWQTWRNDPLHESAGPIQRRPPKSAEPPALVLLRDHFAVVMAAAIVFGTALYVMLMFAIRGTFSRGMATRPRAPADSAASEN